MWSVVILWVCVEAGQGGGLLEGGQGGAPRGAHAGAGTRIPGRCYRLEWRGGTVVVARSLVRVGVGGVGLGVNV